MMDSVDSVIARVDSSDRVPEIAGRVGGALELAALVESNNLPQTTPAAFVVPLGFRGGKGDAVTGMYRQGLVETVAVVLVLEAPSDPTGESARPTLQSIIGKIVAAVAGFAPADAIDVFSFARGDLVQCTAGVVIYQLDFSLSNQLRITA